MRSAVLLLLLPVFASTGCSALIAGAGTDLTHLETREEVRKQFGEPIATGTYDGKPFEDFHSHRKYAEPARASGMGLGVAITFGLLEFITPSGIEAT